MTASTSPCPNCQKPAGPRGVNPTAPFCSARCRMVDLGKWLNEEHRIPTTATEEDEDGDGAPGADGGASPEKDVS